MGSRARYLIVSAALASLVLAGCPKKESPEDIEFAAQQAKKAAQEKKKKVDVFDEFYVDDAKKASGDSKTAAAKTKGRAEAPAAAPAPAPAASRQSALPAASSGSQGFSKNGRYVVQVGSTASESDANRMAGKLKNLGYPAYVAAVQNPTPALTGVYFRVRLGGFDNYSEAKAFGEGTLAAAGYDYWVDRKANDNVGIDGAGFGSAGGQQQYQAPQPYQPAAKPQQPAPTQTPQPYQPAPASVQTPQPAAKTQQPAPTQTPQQYQPAPAAVQTPQPTAKPQQAASAPPPPPQQQPPPPPPPAAKPQQAAPAAAPAQKQAAQPKQSANEWGTTDDWGSDW